jgi:hypothetical protein
MTSPTIMPADMARALLEAATPGPWSSLPLTADRVGPDLVVRVRMREGDSDLCAAAPDLAASVVALHAQVERLRNIADRYGAESSLFARKLEQAQKARRLAASAERGRIVAWLRAWADAYEPKYSVYPDDCRDLADRIERGEVTP